MEKYITKEEYRAAKGVDLDLELKNNDDPTNKAKRFIKEWTDWCAEHLIANYRAYILWEWPDEGDPTNPLLTEERQRLFREGCIEQMDYILSTGDIARASGVNQDLGMVMNLESVQLSRKAAAKFRLAGFMNI